MSARTKVKICGITTLEDARVAIEAGADMLGFNFYKKSVRYIAPETAREIVTQVRETAECVGVFVNEPTPGEVVEAVKYVGLATAQLHGDESAKFCAEVKRSCGVIQALRVGPDFDPALVAKFGGRILLDAATPQFGGSGLTIDWGVAARVREYASELILAGGLHPGNVVEAIAAAKPHVVDACSGLESAPGRKDKDKIISFMTAVRVADEQRKAKVLSA